MLTYAVQEFGVQEFGVIRCGELKRTICEVMPKIYVFIRNSSPIIRRKIAKLEIIAQKNPAYEGRIKKLPLSVKLKFKI